VQFLPYLAVVDDFNTWWVVVYGQVTGDWKANGDRKWKYCYWSDTNVLTAPIALTLKVNITCIAILMALKADGDRKRKYCDWSDTKVLTAPIALTLIVKMKCSAILALLSCGR
jgi:hypothetical protein